MSFRAPTFPLGMTKEKESHELTNEHGKAEPIGQFVANKTNFRKPLKVSHLQKVVISSTQEKSHIPHKEEVPHRFLCQSVIGSFLGPFPAPVPFSLTMENDPLFREKRCLIAARSCTSQGLQLGATFPALALFPMEIILLHFGH